MEFNHGNIFLERNRKTKTKNTNTRTNKEVSTFLVTV